MTIELKDWMNSINFNKRNLMEEDASCVKDYAPYIVNKVLSAEIDCIMFVNEMNIHNHLDRDMQYAFYLNSIRKRKRFSPWLKKTKIDDLECVKKYYGFSNEKAIQALKILTKKQLKFIRERLETGGKS